MSQHVDAKTTQTNMKIPRLSWQIPTPDKGSKAEDRRIVSVSLVRSTILTLIELNLIYYDCHKRSSDR